MDDYQRRDIFLKRVAAIFVIVGGIIGLGRYWITTNKEIEIELSHTQRDQEQALLNRQFDLYFEASRVAAVI